LVIAIESMFEFLPFTKFIEHGAPLLACIVAGDSEP
jgi:hypothetical protein